MNLVVPYADNEIDAIAGWLREGLSASKIQQEFSRRFRSVSRNAIIGIVHRNKVLAAIGLGGNGPRTEKKRAATVRHQKTAKRQALHPGNIRSKREGRAFDPGPLAVASTADLPLAASPASKILADLSWNECRWPVNDAAIGEEHLFCAAQTSVWPYCRHHSLRAGAGYTASDVLDRRRAA